MEADMLFGLVLAGCFMLVIIATLLQPRPVAAWFE
jgi:hypothetical protein